MNTCLRTTILMLVLLTATPSFGAPILLYFEGVGHGANKGAEISGTLRLDVTDPDVPGSGPWIRAGVSSQLDGRIDWGLKGQSEFEIFDLTTLIFNSPRSSLLIMGNRDAGLFLHSRGSLMDDEFTDLSFVGGRIWLRGGGSSALGIQSYGLTAVNTAQLMTIPLPATFPMFMGACLGMAFFGGRRRKRKS